MNIPKVLLAADNDRDMLEYLHEAFQSQVNVCDQCGHEEPTSTCDSASDLKDYLSHFPAAPQPIYDEAKERELFEAWYSDDIGVALSMVQGWRKGDGYSASYERCGLSWHTWQACAQSRAKSGEVGHE